MNLDKFIAGLIEFRKENPESGELFVVTAQDDEGNGFNFVNYTPSLGNMNDDRDFTGEEQIKEHIADYPDEDVASSYKINSVCVN